MGMFRRLIYAVAFLNIFVWTSIAIWGIASRHNQNSFSESSLRFEPFGDYVAVSRTDGASQDGVTKGPARDFAKKLADPKYQNISCYDFAYNLKEPASARYKPRSTVSPLGGTIPRAYWRWPGEISKQAFDNAAAKEWPGCMHCVNVVHYKVVGGMLYVLEKAWGDWQRNVTEEMLQVVLYLFPIPDMDFLLHYGDGCTNGIPAISWNVCRQYKDAGFTMPSYTVWQRALGPMQLAAYKACLDTRYPPNKRKPVVFWRGSTTDTKHGSFNKDNYKEVFRISLHQFARNFSDTLDVRIANPLNCDDFVKEQIKDTGAWIDFEHFNEHCAILDVDGNGWSDRFGQLVHFNTPILKLASNHTGFFEHLMAPNVAIGQFTRDLGELPEKARQLVEECKTGGLGGRGRQLAERMQMISRTLLDHVGIAEAFAYTLHTYKNLSAWKFDPSLTGFRHVNVTCCSWARVPKAFADAVTARTTGGAMANRRFPAGR